MGKFKSVAEIDSAFEQQIAGAADDATKYRLISERETAKSAFYAERDHESQLSTARTQALAQFPKARADLLRGDTPEAILESAKQLHAFAEEQQQAAIDANKQRLQEEARSRAYGGGSGPGGGSGAGLGDPNAGKSAGQQLLDKVTKTLRDGTGTIQDQEANDVAEYVGHALFRNQIDGKLPDDWEGTVYAPGTSAGGNG